MRDARGDLADRVAAATVSGVTDVRVRVRRRRTVCVAIDGEEAAGIGEPIGRLDVVGDDR